MKNKTEVIHRKNQFLSTSCIFQEKHTTRFPETRNRSNQNFEKQEKYDIKKMKTN